MNPIFDATCAAHGLFPVERPLGAVRTLALTRLCDVCGSAYDDTCTGELHDIAALISGAFAALCFACPGPVASPSMPGSDLCAGCSDIAAHTAENARWAWHWAGYDTDEWGVA